jgi:hypothetical protein
VPPVLAGILHRLARERMIGEAHAMTVALRRDLIDAAHSAPPRCAARDGPE